MSSERALSRLYNRLLLGSTIPLLLVITVLASLQFSAQRTLELNHMLSIASEQRLALDAIVKAAGQHVQAMKQAAEDFLATAAHRPPSALRSWIRPREVKTARGMYEGVFLDDLPHSPFKGLAGNLVGPIHLLAWDAERLTEVDMALHLFTVHRLAHLTTGYFRWSYYFPGRQDFIAIFPWAESAEYLQLEKYTALEEIFTDWFSYEIFVQGTPAHNPERQRYWTDAYMDAAGAGLMVSHGAPVYHQDRFMGIVGTDLLLGFLTDFLRSYTGRLGNVWIVDQAGQVLADAKDPSVDQQALKTLQTVVPEALQRLPASQLLQPTAAFQRLGVYYVLARPLESAPWTLVYAVPSPEITTRLLPRFYPPAVVIAGLVVTLFGIYKLLRRYFIRPALALAEYLRGESERAQPARPAVPVLWRPWFDLVAVTFQNNRAYLQQREEAEHDLTLLNQNLERRVAERTSELQDKIVAHEQAETALRIAKEEAEAANRAKSDFLATMSHELRTPLNGILGYAQILRRDAALTTTHQQSLTVIQEAGEHLLGLINAVLDLAKIEAGKLELTPSPFSLSELLHGVCGVFTVRAQQRSLAFHATLAPDLPTTVYGDEQKLRQVLYNLLGNAVKFTDAGVVELGVERTGARLSFHVQDTGRGMRPEELAQLFQPFIQFGDGRQAQEGTGLGLAISRGLVELLGGTLQVDSVLGQGSRFWFTVPLPPTAVSSALAQPRGPIITGYAGPRQRVLVVDDIAENRAVLVDMLTPLGFVVAQAPDGLAALAQAQTWAPDVVLMDIRMPGLDGLEATRRLRALPAGCQVVIVAVSASAFVHDRAHYLAAGANDFVPKPVQYDQLLEVLQTHLALQWDYADGPAAPRRVAPDALAPSVLPAADLAVLQECARRGDITTLLAHAMRLEAQALQGDPFLAEVCTLARGFQLSQLCAVLHVKES